MIESILNGKHKVVVTAVQNIMEELQVSEQEAYVEYRKRMSQRGRKGGNNTTYHGFSEIPGLAQKAGRISRVPSAKQPK